MADFYYPTTSDLRAVASSSIINLTEAYVGNKRFKFIWINNESGQDDDESIIIPNDNPPSGRWINAKSPALRFPEQLWATLNKTGSSLADLINRSASDLNSGTLSYLRLPAGSPYVTINEPNKFIRTDTDGKWLLSHIYADDLVGEIPIYKINWNDFDPRTVGAEPTLTFNPLYFLRSPQNDISIKFMSNSQPGLAIPGYGIETDEQARINVIYGTGAGEALEGITPLGGDLSGRHSAAVVNALRNIPLTFFPHDTTGKNGYVLTLNTENQGTPYFYLAPAGSAIGGSLPDITGQTGALQTDGFTVDWTPITITSDQVNLALGYIPYSSYNPLNFISLTSPLTGYVVKSPVEIISTDNLLVALGKLQGQLDSIYPSQIGHAGHVLSTNGNITSWSNSLGPITITTSLINPLITSIRSDLSNTITITHTATNILTFSSTIAATRFNGSGAGLTNIPPSALLMGGNNGQVLSKNGTTWAWTNTGAGLSLASQLTGYVTGIDGTQLTETDTLLQGFQKLQVQVNQKSPILHVEYITGTTVLSAAQNAAIIDSATDCIIFLPPGVNDLIYRLRNIGTGSVTFSPNGSDTVEKQSTYLLLTTNAFDLVFYSGNWYIL